MNRRERIIKAAVYVRDLRLELESAERELDQVLQALDAEVKTASPFAGIAEGGEAILTKGFEPSRDPELMAEEDHDA